MRTRLSFHGAAKAVTGSCFRIETERGQFLIDCGLFQGSKTEKELNYKPFPFSPNSIDAVVLSHAHIDHSGLLPKLVKGGFQGRIFATPATIDLASIMLLDSAHIQEAEVEQFNRRSVRRGQRHVEPIYIAEDAASTAKRFSSVAYGEWFAVIPDVRARFWNAGHLLGSASIELEISEQGKDSPWRLLFSADIGPDSKLLHPDPEAPCDLDYVICEATYGDTDRNDASAKQRRVLLRDEVRAAHKRNGALLIPSFAVERAQELISDLVQLISEKQLPPVPIYVDSPLATKASAIFAKHAAELQGGATLVHGLQFHGIHFTETVEQSKALDLLREFHIVIAASGMCEAGRIRHRLKNWIWRDEATILLVGYQAQGTLGRIIQDGATTVRIQGDEFNVRARIRSIELYSGHADGPELSAWIRERQPIKSNVFLVHGEEVAINGLKSRLNDFLDPNQIIVPSIDEAFELTARGAKPVETGISPRIDRQKIAHLDWHNDAAKLILDLNEALAKSADEKSKAILIRRIRRALDE